MHVHVKADPFADCLLVRARPQREGSSSPCR